MYYLKQRLQEPQADVQAGTWRKALHDYRTIADAVEWAHYSLRDRVEVLKGYLALPPAQSAPLTERLRSYLGALDVDDAGQPGKALPVYQKQASAHHANENRLDWTNSRAGSPDTLTRR